ncbi:MAG: hypothetical protein HY22_13170 [[Candidatus Thermochlorobacteriaceae] bacterium GBChlB]|nr:MAG: hypothetical protein HY22_13170 [[Candidatus Thermochlorobacteriaceae] bacterium GBChlB]
MGAEIRKPNCEGETPLHLAVTHKQTDIVKALLANGVDVNAKNREDETPLHLAAMYGYIDEVKALVASGADINASTGGKTPLDGASNKEVREFLIRSGAR